MRRREFISLIVGAAAWPLGARAEQAGKLPIIGMIGPATAEHFRPFREQVVQRLGELGLKRVAIFGNSGNPMVASERNAAIAGAHALGLDTNISGVQTVEDIAPTIEPLKGNADALYVCEDPFTVVKGGGDDQRGNAYSATSHNAAFSDQY
jgi:hypothetical protein